MLNRLNFDVNIKVNKEQQFSNSEFTDCIVEVMYTGHNYNGSKISKFSVEQAVPTLFNCPIIGEFIEEKEDFGDHGGHIEDDGNGNIKRVIRTRPYGVINESSKISWQYKEVEGELKECFCCTGKLWTGKYPELLTLTENAKGQSMEITDVEGETDTDGYFDIKKFKFSALCILGDDVQPCFENSKIEVVNLFTKNKENEKDFKYMLDKVKEESCKNNESEGDNNMEKVELKDGEIVVEKEKYESLVDTEKEFQELSKEKKEFEKIKKEFEKNEKKVKELEEFKRKTKVKETIEKYSKLFTDDELDSLKEEGKEKTVEEVESIIKNKIAEKALNGDITQKEEQVQDNADKEDKDNDGDGVPTAPPKKEEFELNSTRYCI